MFTNDGVERNQHIARFVNLHDAIDDECTIALDGDVVVDYTIHLLEYYRAFFSVVSVSDDNARVYEAYELNNIRVTIQQVLTLLSPLCDYDGNNAK